MMPKIIRRVEPPISPLDDECADAEATKSARFLRARCVAPPPRSLTFR